MAAGATWRSAAAARRCAWLQTLSQGEDAEDAVAAERAAVDEQAAAEEEVPAEAGQAAETVQQLRAALARQQQRAEQAEKAAAAAREEAARERRRAGHACDEARLSREPESSPISPPPPTPVSVRPLAEPRPHSALLHPQPSALPFSPTLSLALGPGLHLTRPTSTT